MWKIVEQGNAKNSQPAPIPPPSKITYALPKGLTIRKTNKLEAGSPIPQLTFERKLVSVKLPQNISQGRLQPSVANKGFAFQYRSDQSNDLGTGVSFSTGVISSLNRKYIGTVVPKQIDVNCPQAIKINSNAVLTEDPKTMFLQILNLLGEMNSRLITIENDVKLLKVHENLLMEDPLNFDNTEKETDAMADKDQSQESHLDEHTYNSDDIEMNDSDNIRDEELEIGQDSTADVDTYDQSRAESIDDEQYTIDDNDDKRLLKATIAKQKSGGNDTVFDDAESNDSIDFINQKEQNDSLRTVKVEEQARYSIEDTRFQQADLNELSTKSKRITTTPKPGTSRRSASNKPKETYCIEEELTTTPPVNYIAQPRIAKLPCKTVKEAIELNRDVTYNKKAKIAMYNYLKKHRETDLSKCISMYLNTIFTRRCAVQFNWSGKGGASRLPVSQWELMKVVQDAIFFHFSTRNVSSEQVTSKMMRWFQYAFQRLKHTTSPGVKKITTTDEDDSGF